MKMKENKLRPECLSFSGLLAQNIALISPTMTAALIVPAMFGMTGNVSWMPYALGTIMLLFVAFNLNQFAKRSTNSGSMYIYSSMGLGPTLGSLSGWCLIWAYLFIGIAGTAGFTIFAAKLLDLMGISLPAVLLFAICLVACFVMAYKDMVISAISMLILEGISCILITILCFIVLAKHGFVPDTAQFSMQGVTVSSLGFGVVIAVFSLVGFESSTAFGEEAKNPLKSIPKSIIWSLVATGLFFVFVCYTEVLGTRGYEKTLDNIDTPLNVLSTMYGVPILSTPLSIGAMVSFFALALSCMNAGARVMFAMGKHGNFHDGIRRAHPYNKTPYVALATMGVLMFVIITCYYAIGHREVLDSFNDAGTMGAFGFLGAYVLVTLAAPMYLKKLGELKPMDIVLCAAALLLLAVPAYGAFFPNPAPTPPASAFPYVFLAYLSFGLLRAVAFKVREPHTVEKIREEIKTVYFGLRGQEPAV